MTQTDTTVIGVDLGGTKVAASRVRNGEIEDRVKNSVPAHKDRDAVLSVVVDTIAEVMTPEVSAIGCGVPSVVDVASFIGRGPARFMATLRPEQPNPGSSVSTTTTSRPASARCKAADRPV